MPSTRAAAAHWPWCFFSAASRNGGSTSARNSSYSAAGLSPAPQPLAGPSAECSSRRLLSGSAGGAASGELGGEAAGGRVQAAARPAADARAGSRRLGPGSARARWRSAARGRCRASRVWLAPPGLACETLGGVPLSLPAVRRWTKKSTSSGMSSRRWRSGGRSIVKRREPEIEVVAELAGPHFRRQVLVRRRDQAKARPHRAARADGHHLAVLQRPQQLDLHGQRNVGHFVEEQRAAVGFDEQARSAADPPR